MTPDTHPVITLTEREFLAVCAEALGPGGIERVNRAYVEQHGWANTGDDFLRMRFNLCDRLMRALGHMSVGGLMPDNKRVILHFYDDADAVLFKLRFADVFAQ